MLEWFTSPKNRLNMFAVVVGVVLLMLCKWRCWCSDSSSGVRFGCDVDRRLDLPFPPQYDLKRSTMQHSRIGLKTDNAELRKLLAYRSG